MKVVVQFSGGKDSTAALLWTLKNLTKKPLVVFCDTGFEASETYRYLEYIEEKLNLSITRISSKKYNGMLEMVEHKKRFPSTKARFCTSELKSKPMIDFLLDLDDDFMTVQGIRADESFSRSFLKEFCNYFEYYFRPYNADGDKHTYRAKEIRKIPKSRCTEVIRPIFRWKANDVISFIQENRIEINPLYKKGFKRVGCFPCIMANKNDIRSLSRFYPDRITQISDFESKTGSSLFPPGKIPKRFCANKSYPTIHEVVDYFTDTDPLLFPDLEEKEQSCMSFYNICE